MYLRRCASVQAQSQHTDEGQACVLCSIHRTQRTGNQIEVLLPDQPCRMHLPEHVPSFFDCEFERQRENIAENPHGYSHIPPLRWLPTPRHFLVDK